MTQLDIDREPAAVKHFFESLTVGGSKFEVNGKHVLIRVSEDANEEWSETKNQRRLALIDRKIERVITADELLELEVLQNQMLDHVETVSPIPFGRVRELYEKYVETPAVNGHA